MTEHLVTLDIINKLGLHARAAAKLVETVAPFQASVRIGRGERLIDARSIMALLMLGAGQGTQLQLQVCGDDADTALAAVQSLVARRFDEAE
ncbi:MAG: HPr family phosphocarrier protein [Pseudomonadota bacterium]